MVFAIELVEVYFDGFVGMSSVFGSAEGADERVLMALVVETDHVDFLSLMSFLLAIDVLDYIAGHLHLHQRNIIIQSIFNCSS